MRMTQRSYNQYCPIAHALDLIGERWSLLIVRDLLLGPKRFSDLRAGLPGIGTNILTDRLKALEQVGVIARRVLPPPAASTVYELTSYGRELDRPLQVLAQWGGQSLGSIQHGQAPSRDSILLTVRALARQLFAVDGLRSVAVLLSDERFSETIVAKSESDTVSMVTDVPEEAEVSIKLDLDTLFALAGGTLTLRAVLELGKVHLRGQPALVERLREKSAKRENVDA
jgi:DNA-binding HxlR family transcriptional regulator